MARTMKRWALASGLLTLAGALLWRLFQWDILLTIAITAGTVFYHLGVRLLIGRILDSLPVEQVEMQSGWFRPAAWEQPLYDRLRVRRWKKRMPAYDPTLFDPARHTWTDIARAMCRAELVHEVNVAASFVPLIFSLWFGAFPVFLATSVLAAGYDLLFVLLQRCNRPRVLCLAAREAQRFERLERTVSDETMSNHRHADHPV